MRLDAGADLSACADCHTREGGQLHRRKEARCDVCHPEVVQQIARERYQHPVVGDGMEEEPCLGCHVYHGAEAGFLPGGPIAVCVACHPGSDQAGSHPVGVADPRSGEPITCTSDCHDPHGSTNRWFCREEPGRQLCIGCHEELR